MCENKEIRQLEQFLEQAERLQASRFCHFVSRYNVKHTFSWTQGDGWEIEFECPSDDEVNAFVLTMRFFIQDNENISFRNMAKLVDGIGVESDAKTQFLKLREELNAFLDRTCEIQINDDHPTLREIVWAILYGRLAHAGEKHRETLKRWEINDVVKRIVWSEFIRAIMGLLKFVKSMNECVLCLVSDLKK